MISTMLARAMGKWSYVFLAVLAVIAVLVPVLHSGRAGRSSAASVGICGRPDGQVPMLCAAGTFG
jgi:hypothetical protein